MRTGLHVWLKTKALLNELVAQSHNYEIYFVNLISQINVVAFVGLAVLVIAFVTHLVHIMQRVQKNREERQQKVLRSNIYSIFKILLYFVLQFLRFLNRQLSLHQNKLVAKIINDQAQRVQRQRRKRLTTLAFYTSLMKVLFAIHQHRSSPFYELVDIVQIEYYSPDHIQITGIISHKTF